MRVPSSLAMLGKGLDCRYVQRGTEYKLDLRGLAMASSRDGRTLYFVPLDARAKSLRKGSYPSEARLRRAWSDMEPEEICFSQVRTGKDERLGVVTNIGYWSDKWGKSDRYTHDSNTGAVLTRSGNVYRIRGGKLRVTPRGIVG